MPSHPYHLSTRSENNVDRFPEDNLYAMTEDENEESESQDRTPGRSLVDVISRDIRCKIIDLYQGKVQLQQATLAPTAMVNMRDGFIGPLPAPEETLLCATFDPLAKSSKDLHIEYTQRLWDKILDCQVPNIRVHVLNFDFSFLLAEFFTQLNERSRAYFRSNIIEIRLTFTPGFALLPHRRGIDQWLDWRKEERDAKRHVHVDYKISKDSTKGRAELAALRRFTLLFNSSEGESGEIISVMKTWFLGVYRERRVARMRAKRRTGK